MPAKKRSSTPSTDGDILVWNHTEKISRKSLWIITVSFLICKKQDGGFHVQMQGWIN